MGALVSEPRPLALLAEVSHECPLHCPYCSNPVGLGTEHSLLTTDKWEQVLVQASALGVVQAFFSGGEPLQYRDLDRLVARARREGMYTNLITSGIGLDEARAGRLRDAGLDNVQISYQSDEAMRGDAIAGSRVHERKNRAVAAVHAVGLNLSLNVVLHRFSIERLVPIVEMAASLGAKRIELANVQFYGWAYKNRRLLIPTRDQIRQADEEGARLRERYRGQMEIVYVRSDYYDARPKPCMGGWGQRYMTVDPYGYVLPCPTARSIPTLVFANVQDAGLREIWLESEAFQRFRGTDWMQEPCRSCDFRGIDFGGCRCQAALLAGDAAKTDPVCSLSPDREIVDGILLGASEGGQLADASFRTSPMRTVR